MTIDVREVFTVGQRVKSTQKALDNRVFKKPRSGIVRGFCHGPPYWCVRVQCMGQRSVSSYHFSFWERA